MSDGPQLVSGPKLAVSQVTSHVVVVEGALDIAWLGDGVAVEDEVHLVRSSPSPIHLGGEAIDER